MNKRDLAIRKRIYESKHKVVKESFEEEHLGIIPEDDPILDVSIGELPIVDAPKDTPQQGSDMAISQLLIDAVNDEWEAIKGYNDLITACVQEHQDFILPIIKDIIAEEMLHVGQLQKIMEQLSPNTSGITIGEIEASSQLNNTPSELYLPAEADITVIG